VATPEAFAEAVENREPGAPARLTVLTEGRYRELLLTAGAPPNTPTLAPARSDRVFRSNPSGSGSEPPAPAPVENPYR
jgi:hypothetical protein